MNTIQIWLVRHRAGGVKPVRKIWNRNVTRIQETHMQAAYSDNQVKVYSPRSHNTSFFPETTVQVFYQLLIEPGQDSCYNQQMTARFPIHCCHLTKKKKSLYIMFYFLTTKQRNESTTKAGLLQILTSVTLSVYSLDLHVAIFSQAISARYKRVFFFFFF